MRPATGWNPCKRLRTFRTPIARVEAIPERVSRYFAPGHVDVDVSHWAVHGDLLGRLTAAILRGRRARLQAPPRTIPAMRGLGPRLLLARSGSAPVCCASGSARTSVRAEATLNATSLPAAIVSDGGEPAAPVTHRPHRRGRRPVARLLVVCGVPAAGKSTLAAALARTSGLPVVRSRAARAGTAPDLARRDPAGYSAAVYGRLWAVRRHVEAGGDGGTRSRAATARS